MMFEKSHGLNLKIARANKCLYNEDVPKESAITANIPMVKQVIWRRLDKVASRSML